MLSGGALQREVMTRGRRLMVELSGAPHGSPVFLLHGTPGSRNGPKPRGSVSYRLGVLLISYDRPGYGMSTRNERRSVAAAASDVAAIADDLGIERFSVVGRSGGGPHALACAALLPDRVVRTAVLVGLAPANAQNLDWYDGMAKGNVDAYSTVDSDFAHLIEQLTATADHLLRNPESHLDALREQMRDSDRRIVQDVAMRRLLAATYAEALRHGPYGWIDDLHAFRTDWGFNLEDIIGEVRIWHGADDSFSPVSHAHWLAARIARSVVQIQPGTAHFGAMEVLPEILAWLIAGYWSPSARTLTADG